MTVFPKARNNVPSCCLHSASSLSVASSLLVYPEGRRRNSPEDLKLRENGVKVITPKWVFPCMCEMIGPLRQLCATYGVLTEWVAS